MRANFVHIERLVRDVLLRGVSGDMAEFGVWYGTTFLPIAELARDNGRMIHAVDSFIGMAKETERDGGHYLEGSHSVGGSKMFRELVRTHHNVSVHEGFIPAVLSQLDGARFCFVHIDLDQYKPTLETLRFVWPRMELGGIVACHDWFGNSNLLAAGAIADWMKESGVALAGEQTRTQHCWFIKT